jgi:hypothetical protein
MSRRPPPARPPPRPKPGQVLVYKAIYAYKANQQDELSFEEGDTIYVSEKVSQLKLFIQLSSHPMNQIFLTIKLP